MTLGFTSGPALGGATPRLAPTPGDVVYREGGVQVYRFRRPAAALDTGLPLLLVPSMINRWYVLDLRPGASVVEALTRAGIDTFCLDWGVPHDEDRYLTWDDVLARLRRVARRVARLAGAPRLGVLGYCMGGTLAGIHAALHPEETAALVNLAGPFDFGAAGFMARVSEERFFDAAAVGAAGNVSAHQLQAGFTLLRPTLSLAKLVGLVDTAGKPEARAASAALETWANDGVPFPAAAYVTYIRDLYQQNRLVAGTHRVAGQAVDLRAIRCPVLTIVAERDVICPPAAATALNRCCGSRDTTVLAVPGGHVGAVVGRRAVRELYPALGAWLRARLGYPPSAPPRA
ncbi:MAG: alpha/beta fold hydrolase [Deltaproteobacteria bacterium]|nr:alpha/beta fold hydrolase [Deltaproteobacteria bacterium]